jgi:hypothetical protein
LRKFLLALFVVWRVTTPPREHTRNTPSESVKLKFHELIC